MRKMITKTATLLLAATMLITLVPAASAAAEEKYPDAVQLVLADEQTTVDGAVITEDTDAAVYRAAGSTIEHYEAEYAEVSGYGDATKTSEWHTTEECDKETHIVITKPGTYIVSGSLYGQLSVELSDKRTPKRRSPWCLTAVTSLAILPPPYSL